MLVCSHDLSSQWNSVQSKHLEAWVVPIIDDPAVLELFSSQWRGVIRNTVFESLASASNASLCCLAATGQGQGGPARG